MTDKQNDAPSTPQEASASTHAGVIYCTPAKDDQGRIRRVNRYRFDDAGTKVSLPSQTLIDEVWVADA